MLILGTFLFFLCFFAACTKPINKGWPYLGVEVNSGWNWQAINQGWSDNSIISINWLFSDLPVIVNPDLIIFLTKYYLLHIYVGVFLLFYFFI